MSETLTERPRGAQVPAPELEPEPTPTPPEPEPEPPAPAEPSEQGPQDEKELEKGFRKLDAEAKRHTARITEIMGEDALALVPCEFCEPGMQGFHFPAELLPEDDPRRAAFALVAAPEAAQLVHPERYRTCPGCHGHGVILTGSLNPDHATKMCDDCHGSGYTEASQPPQPPPPIVYPTTTTGNVQNGAPDLPAFDVHNRPLGHPNYGKLQNYMTPAELEADRNSGIV